MAQTGNVTRQIFAEMQKGKREAFDRFFTRNTPRVLVYINYHLGERLRRKVDPSDILQNLHLNLFNNFESFSQRAAERGIQKTLLRMADHEITEAYRYHFKVEKRDARRELTAAYLKGSEDKEASPLAWVPDNAASITQHVVRQEEYQRMMEVLRSLTPLEQFVTVSRVIEGRSAQEIADEIDKSRGAVQMMIARVRDKLRKRVQLDEGKDA